MIPEIAVAATILALLLASLEAGFRLGRRMANLDNRPKGGEIGAVQGATLGLLGLLLGFSFAGAASRFLERQDLIVKEANAIGTAFLRADLLPDPFRTQLQKSLALYVEHRLQLSRNLSQGITKANEAEIRDLHTEIWNAAKAGVFAKPETGILVLNPVNDVIDFHATRVAAGAKHLPGLVLGLLGVCSVISVLSIGYGCGLSGSRNFLMTGALAVLIASALWTTLDLDQSRHGLIQVSDAPLEALHLVPPELPK